MREGGSEGEREASRRKKILRKCVTMSSKRAVLVKRMYVPCLLLNLLFSLNAPQSPPSIPKSTCIKGGASHAGQLLSAPNKI